MIIKEEIIKRLKEFDWKDLDFIIAIILLFLLVKTYSSYFHKNTTVTEPILNQVIQKKDKEGTPYTEIKGTVFTKDQMIHVTDSLKKVLGKGRVIHVVETTTVIDTIYKIKEVYLDTVTGNIYAQDSNKESRISFKGNYKNNTGTFSLKLTPDTASYITTLKNHWFKASDMSVNIYHTNQLFVPAQGFAYTAKIPKTIGCIGPVAGIGYNGKVFPFIGIGIVFNVIGIKTKH